MEFFSDHTEFLYRDFFFEHDTQTNPVIYFLQLEVSEELETFRLLKIL